jgi:hypothetical protein
MERSEKRMDLTVARMVKAEKRMELFDQKLEKSIEQLNQCVKDQREFGAMQSKMNKYFIDYINNNTQRR